MDILKPMPPRVGIRALVAVMVAAALAGCAAPAYESEYRILQARGTASDYEAYLRRHPSSPYADEVRRRIPQLMEEQATRERLAREARERRAHEEAAQQEARARALTQAHEGNDVVALLKLREDPARIGGLFAKIGQPILGDQASLLAKSMIQLTQGLATAEGTYLSAFSGTSIGDAKATAAFADAYYYKQSGLFYFGVGRIGEFRFARVGFYEGRFYALPEPTKR